MSKAAAAREAAIAAWQAVSDFGDERAEGGELSAEDETRMNGLLAEAQAADERYARASAFEGNAQDARQRADIYHQAVKGSPVPWSRVATVDNQPTARQSVGQQFIESDVYKELLDSGALKSRNAKLGVSRTFETRPMAAATDVISPTGDSTAGLVRPTFIPDILPLGSRPLTIRALFSQDTAPDAPIKDARQTTREGAAAAVATSTTTDGTGLTTPAQGVKPWASVGWEEFEVSPKTIAVLMATTRQALATPNRVRSLIDDNGRILIDLAEEDQILNGDGDGEQLKGLLDYDEVQTLDLTAAGWTETRNLDGIRVAKRLVRTGPAQVPADAVVLNPEDSEMFDLLKDLEGRYRAGDPFGTGTEDPPIWRLRRVESEAIDVGTALVGAFKLGGTVYQVQPMVIYTTDSHLDFFARNLIAILFEERIALVIRRPTAFVVVTLAQWEEPS